MVAGTDLFDGVDDRKMPPLRLSSTASSTHMTISEAFEAAQNEDARVLSNISHSSQASYCFIMPKRWMDQLVSYMDGKKRRQAGPAADLDADDNDDMPGKINNSSLVGPNGAEAASGVRSWAKVASATPSSEVESGVVEDAAESAVAVAVAKHDVDEDTDSNRAERRQKWQRCEERHKSPEDNSDDSDVGSHMLHPGAVHGVDYVLVGEHLWTMLSSKFDSDIELRRRCQYRQDSGLMVEITLAPMTSAPDAPPRSGVLVSVPLSGKWSYELSAGVMEAESSTDEDAQPDEVSRFPDSETNSIVSHSHGIEVTRTTSSASSPVLLLPPSTTSTGRQLSLVTLEENSADPASGADVDDPSNGISPRGVRSSPVTNGVGTTTSNKRKRYSSGLGNLGNTCFMNSTLQCLAHTGPLRQYFVNEEYKNDLNRENPLGTGGELASEFAALLSEMWGKSSSGGLHCSSTIGNGYYAGRMYDYGGASSSVVYPRNFKYTLGKHAEQFMGYDQHDSQELATYLLDALHEDTNRVTKKPYVEKPEQEKGETDDVAAEKAWSLHLKREDSRVLESFMGQVKSRVQCPNEACGRVSTTFDPFMYLSVPIPGAAERTIPIVFVPLDPMQRPRKLQITVSKTGTVAVLQKKIANAVNGDEEDEADTDSEEDHKKKLHSEDICVADVFQSRVYAFLEPRNDVDRIRESDTISAYEVRSVAATRAEEEKDTSADVDDEDPLDADSTNGGRSDRSPQLETLSEVNGAGGWEKALGKYVNQLLWSKLLNPGRSSHQDRMDFLKNMDDFIDKCRDCIDSGVEGDADNEPEASSGRGSDREETRKTLADLSETSTKFRNIDTPTDLAVFDYCSRKFREETFNLVKAKKEKVKGGVVIQVLFRRLSRRPTYSTVSYGASSIDVLGPPMVLRVPGTMTVHGLRREIAQRTARALLVGRKAGARAEKKVVADMSMENGGGDEMQGKDDGEDHAESEDESEDDDEQKQRVNVFQQLPLYYCRESRHQSKPHRKLGSLSSPDDFIGQGRPRTFAKSTDEGEQDKVAELVGNHGEVFVYFPTRIELEHLDSEELKREEEAPRPAETQEETKAKTTTVMDCITKYCQMEQLEETEMWYCNRCKDHVRAWKQFHLYRTPPILIVHLKRFQYSATTHRRQKIETFIDFPLTGLDLRGEVMHWEHGEEPVYDCYAVSNHFGGLGGGHYTAYARNDEGVWCHFDDSRVTTNVNENEIVSAAAYVLYYRRRSLGANGMGWEATEDSSALTARRVEDDDMDVDDDDTGAATEASTQEDHGADEDDLLLPAEGNRAATSFVGKRVVVDDDDGRVTPNPQAE